MERLHAPINPCFFGDCLDVQTQEQGNCGMGIFYGLRFEKEEEVEEEEESQFLQESLEDKMTFLEMLQTLESPLLTEENLTKGKALELESCETQTTVKSEVTAHEEEEEEEGGERYHCCSGSSSAWVPLQPKKPSKAAAKRKRKRTRPTKNKEEVESQRMTHIAVERNRRRQMNYHLSALRSLMPTSYIQRGDQASIIGGAVDFVKELEQLLQSLEAQKRLRSSEQFGSGSSCDTISGSGGDFEEWRRRGEECTAEMKSRVAEIGVVVIQSHVNLKIECERRPGQLIRAIVALEDLRLTVLHLNITSLHSSSILYSFNLKIEEDCKLRSADEIASTVHQIFSFVNGN